MTPMVQRNIALQYNPNPLSRSFQIKGVVIVGATGARPCAFNGSMKGQQGKHRLGT